MDGASGEEFTIELIYDGAVEHEWAVMRMGEEIESESEFTEDKVQADALAISRPSARDQGLWRERYTNAEHVAEAEFRRRADISIVAFAQQLADRGDWGHMDGWGGWMWLWGSLMMLSWVVVIAAAVWFFSRRGDPAAGSRANEILDERYARGELTTDEYRERVEQLR